MTTKRGRRYCHQIALGIFVALAQCLWLGNLAANQSYDQAVSLYGQKKYKEALAEWIKVIQSDPKNSSAYLYAANCYYSLGDKATALKMYQNVISSFPQSAAASSAGVYLKNLESAKNLAGDATGKAPAQAANASKATGKATSVDRAAASVDATPVQTNIAALLHIVRARKDRPEVSTAAVTAVKTALDGLPASVKALLLKSNIQIYVTPTVEDFSPGLKYEQATGYEGDTYKSCPAYFDGTHIVLAEHTISEVDESVKPAFPASEVVNAFYHETGHAIDYCLQEFSQSEEYKHAYLLDSAKIEPDVANELRYYLQKSATGQAECCAELTGTLLGQKDSETGMMRSAFPLTLKVLHQKLKM